MPELQLNLVVGQMARSIAFYRRLGIEFADAPPEWAEHHRSTADGAQPATLEFDSETSVGLWDRGWPGGPGVVLTFTFDSRDRIDELVAELETDGYRVQQPPHDAFWGARYAVVADPDGNAVGLSSPIDPARSFRPRPG